MSPDDLATAMFNELRCNFKYYLRDHRYGVNYFLDGIRYCVKNGLDCKVFIRKLFSMKPEFVLPLYERVLDMGYWDLPDPIKEDIVGFLQKFVVLK